ncbi:TWiK family of potassium channels protein 7-like [Homarus americanus]|uniref:TWiK family of potassium channels protein 7-like n=1 Tax=Homarus americanus TaxID=6706 RepID=UPI001C455E3E|nr:TWiK family of potassium channels protein 7-like [Homarus americanus]
MDKKRANVSPPSKASSEYNQVNEGFYVPLRYGHIAPKTKAGRLFTILYNVIGIPLLLIFLANIGDFLANSCRYLYSRVCCRWCRFRRRLAETRAGKTVEKRSLWKDDVGYEKYMATEKVNVPIVVNLCIITVYLMLGGVLFKWWEGWDLLTAVYFTFITLTTIGFGDLVPGNSFLDLEDGITAGLKMLVTVLLCLFGMALISMCINLMQEQLVHKTRWLLMELGIVEEEIDPMEKYKYKKTKKGTVVETKQDRDGNKRLSLMNTNEGESTTTRPPTVSNIKEELEDM